MKHNKPNAPKSDIFKLIFKSLVSIILLFLIFRFIGIKVVYNVIRNANFYYLTIATFFTVFHVLFKAIRWCAIISIFNKSLNIISSATYTLISYAFGIVTPGRLGEFIKAKYLAEKSGISYLRSFLTVIIDKIFDVITVVLFALASLPFLQEKIFLADYFVFALVLYIIILVLIFVCLGRILALINNFLPKKYKNSFKNLNINGKVYVKSLLFSVFIWLTSSIQAFFVIKALGITQISFYAIVGAVTLMALSSLLPISFGGIGVREVVAISFFLHLGVPAEKSVIFSLLYTFVTFAVPAIIGAILYANVKGITKK